MDFFGILSTLETVDFGMVVKIFGGLFFLFWLIVVGWVIMDAFDRTRSHFIVFIYAFMVLSLNVLGLVVYLIIRPKTSLDDNYWADLERRYLKFETAGLGECPSCGTDIQPNFVFCPVCSYNLRVKCPSCDVYLEPEWNICPFCSHVMRQGGQPERRPRRARVIIPFMNWNKRQRPSAVGEPASKKTSATEVPVVSQAVRPAVPVDLVPEEGREVEAPPLPDLFEPKAVVSEEKAESEVKSEPGVDRADVSSTAVAEGVVPDSVEPSTAVESQRETETQKQPQKPEEPAEPGSAKPPKKSSGGFFVGIDGFVQSVGRIFHRPKKSSADSGKKADKKKEGKPAKDKKEVKPEKPQENQVENEVKDEAESQPDNDAAKNPDNESAGS